MGKTSKTKLLSFIIMLNVTIIAAAAAMVLVANQTESFAYYTRFRGPAIPSGYHYEATDATRTTSATKEYWVACNTHEHYLLQDPEAEEIDFVDDISNDSPTGFTVKLSDPYWIGSSTWDGTRIDAVYPAGKGISTGNTSVMGEISFTFASAYTSGESITIKEGSSFLSDSNGSNVYYSVPNCYEFIYDGSSWSLNKTPVYGNWVEGLTPYPDMSGFIPGTDDRLSRYDAYDFEDGFVYGTQSAATNNVYSKVDIGGREDVGKFDPTTWNWSQQIEIYQASHSLAGYRKYGPEDDPNNSAPKATRKGMVTVNNYKYVTFDIYLSSGSDVAVCAPFYTGNSSTSPFDWAGSNYTRLWADRSLTYTNSDPNQTNVSVYDLNGNQVTSTAKETWYRVVVAYKVNMNDDGTGNHSASINMQGTNDNPVYVDNVRCYHDASWWDDFDVDKGLTASVSNPVVSMNTYTPSVSNVIFRGEELSSSDYSTRVTISDPSIGSVSDKTVSVVGEGGFDIYVSISVGEKRIYSIKSRHETTFVPSKLKKNNDNVTVTNNVSAAGRTGVTQFTWPNSPTWNTAYAFEPTATTSADMTPDDIAKAFVGSGIKYMSFEFSITSGSIFRVYSRLAEDSTKHMWKRVVASTGNIETDGTYPNNQVAFYDMSGNVITSGLVVGSWYKCVVDYSFITTASSSTYFDVMFNAAQGTYYVDNVYYYSTSATPWGAQ